MECGVVKLRDFDLCCWYMEMKTGTFVISILEIVFSSILVFVFGVGAILAFTGKLSEIVTGEKDPGPIFYRDPWTDPFFVVLTIFLLLFLLSLGFAITLLVGVRKSSHSHLKSWLKFKIFQLTVFFVLSLQYILVVRFSDFIFLSVGIVFFLLNLYFYAVVNVHSTRIKKSRDENPLQNLEEMKALHSQNESKS